MASPESVRRHNLSLLLRHLHQSGALSRSEIGGTLGMTRSTIGELVADLRARGLVEEGDPARLGAPGRPSLVARPNPEGAAAITAEIAVNSLSAAVVGLGGRILHRARVTHQPRRLAVDQTIEDIGKLIQTAQASIPPGMLGLRPRASPSPGWSAAPTASSTSRRTSGGGTSPLAGWSRTGSGSSLPVTIANEADLGALAEHTWGAGVGVHHLVYVSSEVGVGGGLVIDGRPLVGAAGCAGEVGHFQVNPLGERCRCGAIGCWETEIGGPAILRRIGIVEKNYKPEAVTRLLREAAWGDPVALAAVEDVGRWLGDRSGRPGQRLQPPARRARRAGSPPCGRWWSETVDDELRARVMAPVARARRAHPTDPARRRRTPCSAPPNSR